MVIPRDKNRIGIIFEFKTVPKGRPNMELEELADVALQQIEDKKI